jgi:hypothetical protein
MTILKFDKAFTTFTAFTDGNYSFLGMNPKPAAIELKCATANWVAVLINVTYGSHN